MIESQSCVIVGSAALAFVIKNFIFFATFSHFHLYIGQNGRKAGATRKMKETRRMIMRRTKMAVLGMMMVLSMTACAGKAETKSIGAEITVQETTEEEMTTETVKADRGESEESMIGMPNPYTDHGTLKEAEEDAGFKIQIPDEIRGVKAVAFRNLGTEMLEVIYYDGDAEVARVRKGTGAEDISGDYVIDSEVKTVEVGEKFVTIKKEAEGCYLAVWTDGDYSYSVSVQTPFSQEELTGLVEQVQ